MTARSRSFRGWSHPHGSVRVLTLALTAATVAVPMNARAQASGPCELTTCFVLGAAALTVGTGVAIGYGRQTGGVSTMREGLTAWSLGFGATAVAGIALGGNKDRQDRAVYAAGLGAVAGALTGLAIDGLGIGGEDPGPLAAAVIGAAVGVIVGGIYGALSYEDEPQAGSSSRRSSFPPALVVRLGL